MSDFETDTGPGDASADDFLNSGGGGNRGKYLKDWKKRASKKINVWLHTRFTPKCVYRHSFKRIVVREKDGVQTREIWGGNFCCHESLKVSEKQYEREDDGSRKYPPCTCAFCKFLERLRSEVNATRDIVEEARSQRKKAQGKDADLSVDEVERLVGGRLYLTTPIFEFEDDKTIETITAGGFAGLINDKILSEEECKFVRRAKINIRDAWRETGVAKANWLFQIVDDDDVGGGVQKAWQAELVGEKTKTVIHDKRAALGKDGGDPWKNPYCIQWEHMPDAKGWGKQYAARPMDPLVKYRPEIASLIRDEPLDVSRDIALFSPKELAAQMEASCKYPALLPMIAEYFGKATEPEQPAAGSTPAAPAARPAAPPAPAAAPVDDDVVACDGGGSGGCGKPIKLSDAKCPHCGFVYEVEPAAPPPPPPPPKTKTRSEVMAERAAAAAATPAPAPAPVHPPAPLESPATISRKIDPEKFDPHAPIDPEDDLPFLDRCGFISITSAAAFAAGRNRRPTSMHIRSRPMVFSGSARSAIGPG